MSDSGSVSAGSYSSGSAASSSAPPSSPPPPNPVVDPPPPDDPPPKSPSLSSPSSSTYAQDDEHMRNMEKEAYLKGNLLFRDWEDFYKNYRQTNSPK